MTLTLLLLAATLLFLYFIALGGDFLRRILPDLPFLEKTTLALPLGIGITSTAVFLLGTVGQIRRPIILLILSLSWSLCYRETLSFVKGFKDWAVSFRKGLSKSSELYLLLLGVHLSLNFLSSLAPPIEFDVLNYHLVLAKQYVATHALSPRADIQWSFGPQLIEMLMTFGLCLRCDLLSSLLVFLLCAWLLAVLYQLGKCVIGKEGALLATVLFWCMPLVVHYAPLLKTDLGMSVFVLLACDQWLRLTKEYEPGRLFLFMLFLGFAIACKFTALPSITVIGLAVLWALRKRWGERSFQRTLGCGLLALTCVVLPYCLRSYWLTGNPFYPNAYSLFGGRFWNAEMDQVLRERVVGQKGLLHFFTHPLQFSSTEIFGGHIGSPLFLTFLPLLWFYRPLDRSLRKLLGISFALYGVSYTLFEIHSRYYFPVLCLLSIPTAYAIQRVCKESSPIRFVGIVSVWAFFLFNLLVTYIFTNGRISSALGMELRSSYLSRVLPYHPVIAYANAHTEAKDRFALLYTPSYYLERDSMNATIYSAGIMFYSLKTPERLAERLQELKIRYAILTEQQVDRLDWKLFDELKRQGKLLAVYRYNGYGLYRFVPTLDKHKGKSENEEDK